MYTVHDDDVTYRYVHQLTRIRGVKLAPTGISLLQRWMSDTIVKEYLFLCYSEICLIHGPVGQLKLTFIERQPLQR